MVVGTSLGIMGVWFIFSLQLRIQNDIARAVAIWLLVFVLTAGAAATDYLRKRKA